MFTCCSLIIAIKQSLESDFVNNNNQRNKVKIAFTNKQATNISLEPVHYMPIGHRTLRMMHIFHLYSVYGISISILIINTLFKLDFDFIGSQTNELTNTYSMYS